jgi:hypothetical protein
MSGETPRPLEESVEKREESIGALWRKQSAKGEWFSGTLQLEGKDGPKIPIVVFANSFRGENERAPDFRILRGRPKEDRDRSILDGRHSDAAGPGDDEIPF